MLNNLIRILNAQWSVNRRYTSTFAFVYMNMHFKTELGFFFYLFAHIFEMGSTVTLLAEQKLCLVML